MICFNNFKIIFRMDSKTLSLNLLITRKLTIESPNKPINPINYFLGAFNCVWSPMFFCQLTCVYISNRCLLVQTVQFERVGVTWGLHCPHLFGGGFEVLQKFLFSCTEHRDVEQLVIGNISILFFKKGMLFVSLTSFKHMLVYSEKEKWLHEICLKWFRLR